MSADGGYPAEDHETYDEFAFLDEVASEHGLMPADPPRVRREFVDVGDARRVSALLWGEDEPKVVLIHGGGQNAHTWDAVALALHPLPLLAIDLPGHGHSDEPTRRYGFAPALPGTAHDVAEVVRSLAPSANGLVGMSFGGIVTVAVTDVAPALVRKVMLVDVVPGGPSGRARQVLDFLQGPATFATFDEMLSRTMRFNPTRSPASLRRGVRHNAIQLADGSWIWRHSRWRLEEGAHDYDDAQMDSSPPEMDMSGALSRVAVPLLLARGMRSDSVLTDEDEERLRRVLPHAEIERFAEAGHSIQGDMPLDLAATIARFMS